MATILRMATAPRDEEWMVEVGKRLARTRKAIGMTQEVLADLLNVERTTWGNWERGERLADPAAMQRLKRLKNIPLDWIYDGDPSNLPNALFTVLAVPERNPSSARRRSS